jgi:hypothetical protein
LHYLGFLGVLNRPFFWDMNGTRYLAGRNCLSIHRPVFTSAVITKGRSSTLPCCNFEFHYPGG